jgi:hypothetical protein
MSGPERRHASRYEVIAQANVASGGDAYLLPVRNISMTGAFLEGNPAEHADLKPGVEVEIVLSAAAAGMGDEEVVNIQCRGCVARIEPGKPPRLGGFGVTLQPASAADATRMQALLGRLAHVPPPRPATQRA